MDIVAHIRGAVHSRIETILLDIPDTRDSEKEFEKGLEMSKEQAIIMTRDALNILNVSNLARSY
ncbi:hypothetical protein [Paenibacillus sp. LHD-38]|uniref:hypothetical protein n=1 Tax=Paenibacillus sp. LHD-38 TaxID=3072143 RepID=UPI00280E6295|nr:hypothetical protein [Paenibacillus sp. LHD-38]MDQ8734474.1 hypothetical protein [Paenibacillus sp. LHD-38]